MSDMIKAKVKPLFRVKQNQYKETLARFRRKDIIHDIFLFVDAVSNDTLPLTLTEH